jgi:hypothetical protein
MQNLLFRLIYSQRLPMSEIGTDLPASGQTRRTFLCFPSSKMFTPKLLS